MVSNQQQTDLPQETFPPPRLRKPALLKRPADSHRGDGGTGGEEDGSKKTKHLDSSVDSAEKFCQRDSLNNTLAESLISV